MPLHLRNDFRDKITKLDERTDIDPRVKAQMMEMQKIEYQRAQEVQINRLEKQRDKQLKQSQRALESLPLL